VFQEDHRAAPAPLAKKAAQPISDERQAGCFIAHRVTPWMEHDAHQAQRFGTIQLVAHRFEGLAPVRPVGAREIDEVARMREDRSKTSRLDPRPELTDLGGWHETSPPLAGVLREDLERVATVGERALDRSRESARDRHVSAEPRHHVTDASTGRRTALPAQPL